MPVLSHELVARYISSNESTVRTGQKVISGGIIAVIVVIIVTFIASCVGGLCFYKKAQKKRKERQMEMNKWAANNNMAMNGNPPAYSHAQAGYTSTPAPAHVHHGHHGDTNGGVFAGDGGASSGGGNSGGGCDGGGAGGGSSS